MADWYYCWLCCWGIYWLLYIILNVWVSAVVVKYRFSDMYGCVVSIMILSSSFLQCINKEFHNAIKLSTQIALLMRCIFKHCAISDLTFGSLYDHFAEKLVFNLSINYLWYQHKSLVERNNVRPIRDLKVYSIHEFLYIINFTEPSCFYLVT